MMKESIVQQLSPVGEEEIPVLPLEIMVEILSRFPTKALCKFRCVSKPWLSLISSPLLAKSHLKKTIRNDLLYCQRKRVIISSYNLYSLEYESIGKDGRFDENLVAVELDYPLKDETNGLAGFLPLKEDNDKFAVIMNQGLQLCEHERNWVDILGSCNGLVCISPYEDTLYVFNPSTRESRRIPDTPSGLPSNGYCVFGFGFDCLNDDYKVVKLGCGTVSVYSLKTDSWRMVCHFPYYDNVHKSWVLLHGAIHWMTCYRDQDGADLKCVVAAFSLGKEVFLEMLAPSIVKYSFEFVLGVLNGCLCVLHNHHQMRNDFWVMTEYGVGESWTKLTLSLSYNCMISFRYAQSAIGHT